MAEKALQPPVLTPRRPKWRAWQVILLVMLGSMVALILLLASVAYGVHRYWAIRGIGGLEIPPPAWAQIETVRETTPSEPATPSTGVDSVSTFVPVAPARSDSATAPRLQPAFPGDDIFRDAAVPRLEIYIPKEGLSSLSRDPRKYVPAMMRERSVVYTNIAIRLKGSIGSFRPLGDRPALTLNFENFANGQTWHGLKKIHLNNSVQDPSRLSEKISRELFSAANVPVPRAGNALVNLNGRPLGLYVVLEGMNKQFLKRHFKDTTGNVYEGGLGQDITDSLRVNDGENPRDRARLSALVSAARLPLQSRIAGLDAVLDLDRFISFAALETMLWHWDGYTLGRNNYRIFHDRTTDRMVFIPHGLDQLLENSGGSFGPNTEGLVARAAFEIPEIRQRYNERVADLATNVFRIEAITNRIREVTERVAAAIREPEASAFLTDQSAENFQRHAKNLARRFSQRASSLRRHVFPAQPPQFGNQNVLALEDWEPRVDEGEPLMEVVQDRDGNSLLHITSAARCTASWRTQVQLGSGRYHFTARMMTKGVALNRRDSRDGAGLRISGKRISQKIADTSEWTPVAFDFEVAEAHRDIVLVCELRANVGEVWFDLHSLKLSRLDPQASTRGPAAP